MQTSEIQSNSAQKQTFPLVFIKPFDEGMWEMETHLNSFSAEVSGQIQRRQFYQRRKTPWYSPNRKLGWAKTLCGPCRNWTTIHRLTNPYTNHYTHCAIRATVFYR